MNKPGFTMNIFLHYSLTHTSLEIPGRVISCHFNKCNSKCSLSQTRRHHNHIYRQDPNISYISNHKTCQSSRAEFVLTVPGEYWIYICRNIYSTAQPCVHLAPQNYCEVKVILKQIREGWEQTSIHSTCYSWLKPSAYEDRMELKSHWSR